MSDMSRRGVLLAGAGLSLTACTTPSAGEGYSYVDAVPAMLPIAESGMDMPAKVARYRAEVIARYPAPFALLAPMNDAAIADQLGDAAQHPEAFRQLDTRMPAAFAEAWRQFVHALPATLDRRTVVYILPAPSRVVGGAVRALDPNREAVLFGSSQLIDYLDSASALSTLVHHELTHAVHMQTNPEIRQAITSFFQREPGPPAKLYQMMWLEGLAGYVSKTLNPSATMQAVLTDPQLPANVAGSWPKVLGAILENLDSTDLNLVDASVGRGAALGIPNRSGYYVGMLVAGEIVKRHALPQLPVLAGETLRTEIRSALQTIAAAGPPG
jgi:hypothetical protein